MTRASLPDFRLDTTLADVKDAEALLKQMHAGVTVASLRGISPRRLEAYYALGYNAFRCGRLQDAQLLFSFILMNNHLDGRTHKALGLTFQAMRQFEQALKSYGAASLMAMTDPEPPVRIAECLLALGRIDEASGALDFADGTFKRRPDERLSQRVAALRAAIQMRCAA